MATHFVVLAFYWCCTDARAEPLTVTAKLWIRYEVGGQAGFGLLEGEDIAVCQGDMFGAFERTGELRLLTGVTTLLPCVPGKLIGLWNNYHA